MLNDIGYFLSENLVPGKAYWLRSSGEGEIIISSSVQGRRTKSDHLPDHLNSLTLNNKTLYFGEGVLENHLMSYSLPPKPPLGAFDIRFSGDTKLCSTDECVIEAMNYDDQLTLECDIKGADKWEIIDENGDVFMCSGPQILKLNGGSGRFILRNRTSSEIPTEFTLFPAFPNPFNPSTTIGFSLGSSATATLRVYDITGKIVNTLLEHELELGHHSVQWNASGFPSGIYFIQFSTDKFIETQKIVLMK